MDRTSPCGGDDVGSIPAGSTQTENAAQAAFSVCVLAAAMIGEHANLRGGVAEILERRREDYP